MAAVSRSAAVPKRPDMAMMAAIDAPPTKAFRPWAAGACRSRSSRFQTELASPESFMSGVPRPSMLACAPSHSSTTMRSNVRARYSK